MCDAPGCKGGHDWNNSDFVHLHNHSEFSQGDANPSPEKLAQEARRRGHRAIALTDHGVMGGIVQLFKGAGDPMDDGTLPIKPIAGIEAYVCDNRFEKPERVKRKKNAPVPEGASPAEIAGIEDDDGMEDTEGANQTYHFTLIAKNYVGYQNLCRLSSKSYIEGFHGKPRVDEELLDEHREGIIALSGCLASRYQRLLTRGDEEAAKAYLLRNRERYGEDFYLEMQFHGIEQQKKNLPIAVRHSKETGVGMAATNDIHWIKQSDADTHALQLTLAHKAAVLEAYKTRNFHMKTGSEMCRIFKGHPSALLNTVEIAEKVESYSLLDPEPRLPTAHIPTDDARFNAFRQSAQMRYNSESEAYLYYLVMVGLKRLGKWDDPVYRARAKEETDQIVFMGVQSYLLIQVSMVDFMRRNDIEFGVRGSASGSLVLYALGISWVDPIEWNLMFQRFLNPGRGKQHKLDVDGLGVKDWLFSNDRGDADAQARAVRAIRSVVNERKEELAPFKPAIEKELWYLENQSLATYVTDLAAKGHKAEKNSTNLWSAHLLGITDEAPKGEMIVSKGAGLPDIDSDIRDDKRHLVVAHLVDEFGRDNVTNIGTTGCYAEKMALTECAKIDFDFCRLYGDEVAKKATELASGVPPKTTLEEAIQSSAQLRSWRDKFPKIFSNAALMIGTAKQFGIHPSGIIVSSEPVMNFAPIERRKNKTTNEYVFPTAYDMGDIERVGGVKFDLLGLSAYQMIGRTVKLIKSRHGVDIDITKLSQSDPDAFRVFHEKRLQTIFQFASEGMARVMDKINPNCIEDLVVIAALYRPGPMANIDLYAENKKDPDSIVYPDEITREVLSVTYGIPVYQEQGMVLGRQMAGFDWTETQELQKAISKKDPPKFEKVTKKFKEKALARGVDKNTVEYVMDKLKKFDGYAFNRSHSVCYGMLAYINAWFLAHYPHEWYAACIQSKKDKPDEMKLFIQECRERSKIRVLPPNVNSSTLEISIDSKNALVLPLDAVSGVGAKAETIITLQPFEDLKDFVVRVRPDRGLMEALLENGALRCFEEVARAQTLTQTMTAYNGFMMDMKHDARESERLSRLKFTQESPLAQMRREEREASRSPVSTSIQPREKPVIAKPQQGVKREVRPIVAPLDGKRLDAMDF